MKRVQANRSLIEQPVLKRTALPNRRFVSRSYQTKRLRRVYSRILTIQLSHICLFFILSGDAVQPWLLASSGVACLSLYSYLFISEIRFTSSTFSPFLFYLGASTLRLGVAVVYAAMVISAGENQALLLGPVDATPWLMEGHLIAMLGDWFFISGYVLTSSNAPRLASARTGNLENRSWRAVYRAGVMLAVLSIGVRAAAVALELGFLGKIIGYFSDFGVPAGVFLMLSSMISRKYQLLSTHGIFALGLLAVNVLISLGSYMKSELFIALFPVIFLVIDQLRRKWQVGNLRRTFWLAFSLFFLGYILVFSLSAYSQLRRPAFWDLMGHGETLPSTMGTKPEIWPYLKPALLSTVPGTKEFEELHEFPVYGAWGLLRRLTVTELTAWAYQRVESKGTKEGDFFDEVLVIITPRIFWPDKPMISPGRDFAVELGSAKTAETATTAIALTMAGSYYWWGGFAGLIVGMFCSGAALAFTWAFVRSDWHINPIGALVTMQLTWQCFHWFEAGFHGAFPMYLYVLIVFVPMILVVRRWMGNRSVIIRKQVRLHISPKSSATGL